MAPILFAGIVAAALLIGSLVGMSAASLMPHAPGAAVRPTAAAARDALVTIRAGERASETADELASEIALVGPALARVRADERASEIPLEAVLAQIRREEETVAVH